MNTQLNQLISGAIMMGYLVAGLCFLRFWKASGDRLFAFFAIAFWVLAGQRPALALNSQTNERYLALCVMRLIAFLLILGAILDKNRTGQAKR